MGFGLFEMKTWAVMFCEIETWEVGEGGRETFVGVGFFFFFFFFFFFLKIGFRLEYINDPILTRT